MRIGIVGGPKTGKTTLANSLGITVLHLDDLIPEGWSQGSTTGAVLIHNNLNPYVVEGVQLARVLRKWLTFHPTGKPLDELWVLQQPLLQQTQHQQTMTKGIFTVLAQIRPDLLNRGVVIKSGKQVPKEDQ